MDDVGFVAVFVFQTNKDFNYFSLQEPNDFKNKTVLGESIYFVEELWTSSFISFTTETGFVFTLMFVKRGDKYDSDCVGFCS